MDRLAEAAIQVIGTENMSRALWLNGGQVVAMQNDGRPLVMFGGSSSSRSSQFTVPGKNVSKGWLIF